MASVRTGVRHGTVRVLVPLGGVQLICSKERGVSTPVQP